jgi:hypothetical protein
MYDQNASKAARFYFADPAFLQKFAKPCRLRYNVDNASKSITKWE